MKMEDDRGFIKADLVLLDESKPNFQTQVNLVERNVNPVGYALVDSDRSGKKTQFDLVELASNIQKADEFTVATAGSKLSVIVEQMKFLQQQARKVLEESNRNKQLHHIACNFKKVPGKLYYVYKKPSGQEYISMLSPEEWGSKCPEFAGAYKLESDMTWTPLDKVQQRKNDYEMIDQLLSSEHQPHLQIL
uniref:C1orf50 homolog n=1 Tax=Lepeophtheirus salmonis TaxID=72036 RepID=C1BVM5_LEPSM|nr:C1orf50 homolog [Lepeophtheirus salmonis]